MTKQKRLPVITEATGARVCQRCLTKWARVRVLTRVFCNTCANKEREELRRLEDKAGGRMAEESSDFVWQRRMAARDERIAELRGDVAERDARVKELEYRLQTWNDTSRAVAAEALLAELISAAGWGADYLKQIGHIEPSDALAAAVQKARGGKA